MKAIGTGEVIEKAMESKVISLSASVDVPSLEERIRFYCAAFGFAKISPPYAGVASLKVDGADPLVLAKKSGLAPCPQADPLRHYDRYWTPVHLDFHVDDFKTKLTKALKAGAKQEQLYEIPGKPSKDEKNNTRTCA